MSRHTDHAANNRKLAQAAIQKAEEINQTLIQAHEQIEAQRAAAEKIYKAAAIRADANNIKRQ